MLEAIRAHYAAGKPMLAECGGLMACVEELVDHDGQSHRLLGLMPGQASMAGRLQALGSAGPGHRTGAVAGPHLSSLPPGDRLATPGPEPANWRAPKLNLCIVGMAWWPAISHGYFPSAPELVAGIFRGQAIRPLTDKEPDHA